MQNNLNLTKQKKALSQVVSTMLIILIAIGAITILGVIIMNSIKNPLLSPTVSCNEFISSSKIEIENVCYNENTKEIKLTIGSSTNTKKLDELSFQLSNNGKTEKWTCGGNVCNSCNLIKAGETIIYYLTPNEKVQLNQANQASLSIRAGECLVGNVKINKACN